MNTCARSTLPPQLMLSLATTTASERLGVMWRLTLDAWAASGKLIPDYTRAETPGRMVRRG
jgi:hypothetical protein